MDESRSIIPTDLNATFATKKEMTSTSTPLFVCLFMQIPQDFPLDKACLLGCGVPTGYGAAVNTAKVMKLTLRNTPYVQFN